jgi:alpha-beta hydrolase superfamily lysophospholipase
MIRIRTVFAAGLLLLGVVAAGYPPSPVSHSSRGSATACQRTTVPVTLTPADTTSYEIVGWLCARGPVQGKTVQLLVSGFTYDHHYWDMPYQPTLYSYVRAALNAGYATFNIDRIGVGQSDRPPAAQVTVASQAYTIHQTVQALRQGAIAGTPFAKVIGVGHSMGAAIWIYEAANYSDVDGLVLADYLHQPNVAQQKSIAATMYPAQQDARFGASVPPGYLTSRPGTRGTDFYRNGFVDQAVVALDESLKQTATTGEAKTLDLARDPRFSRAIQVPVLLVVGEHDDLGCASGAGLSCASGAAILAREQANYSPQACLAAVLLPSAGHDTNLHLNARQWFASAALWADKRVGSSAQRRPIQSCRA